MLLIAGCGKGSPSANPPVDERDAGDAGDADSPAGMPDHIDLVSPAMLVRLTLRPTFGMRVTAPDGSVVLDTFNGERAVDGDSLHAYGALGATHREVTFGPLILEGFDRAIPVDEPWIHASDTVDATANATSAMLTLHDPAEPDSRIAVTVAVDGAELEVDAKIAADRADPSRTLNLLGQSFLSTADEHFVGLGEREDDVDHRGRHYQCWTEEGGLGGGEAAPPGPTNPFPNGPGMTYLPVPFFISSRGYGLWIDTSFRTDFALASDDPGLLRISAETPRLHYRVFVANDPKQVLAAFTAQSGRAVLPAPWVFGPRRRMDVNKTVGGVLEAEALRDRGVPTTVADDTTHFLPNQAALGHEDELRAWTGLLHGLGYKAIGYFNGHVSTTLPAAAPLLADGRNKGVFVHLDDGSEFQTTIISGGIQQVVTLDLSKPDAISWFEERMGEALALGYDGWMLDFGEYLPQHSLLANGMTGFEAHNLYPLFLQRAAANYLRRVRGDDWMFFARSGGAGTQALAPVVWSGDPSASFDDARGLPAQVRAALNAGLSGIPFWGSDISGFTCLSDPPPDKEVYLRWAAFGALSSDMHDENACSGRSASAPEKWTLWSDDETVAIYGAFAALHTRLFPYLYAAASEAVRTGLPVMRHPLLMNPESAAAWTATDQYWFGPSLFVAPVIRRGATSRQLRLPPGTWFDWWTNEAVAGDAIVVRDAPLGQIPLYLRAGGLVAMLSSDVQTLAATDDASVIDMSDRDGVLDARAGLSAETPSAAAQLVDGTTLSARGTSNGVVLPSDVMPAADDAALETCDRCGRIDTLPDGTQRVRITASGSLVAGTLSLMAERPLTPLRVRWDVLLR